MCTFPTLWSQQGWKELWIIRKKTDSIWLKIISSSLFLGIYRIFFTLFPTGASSSTLSDKYRQRIAKSSNKSATISKGSPSTYVHGQGFMESAGMKRIMDYSEEERLYMIENYFKFAVFRYLSYAWIRVWGWLVRWTRHDALYVNTLICVKHKELV